VVLGLIGCWYHIILRYGKNWGYEVYLYIAFAFWGFDRLARLLRMAWYNRAGIISPGYAELVPDTDLIKLTIFPSSSWKFSPGQHSFLYFHSINHQRYSFWESHPFSVATWSTGTISSNTASTIVTSHSTGSEALPDEDKLATKDTQSLQRVREAYTGDIVSPDSGPSVTFLIRASTTPSASLHGLTRRLYKEALSHFALTNDLITTHASHSFPVTVSTEGPYTHSPAALHGSDVVLCLAGGVGVTALLGYVKAYAEHPQSRQSTIGKESHQTGSKRHIRPQRMIFAFSARQNGLINEIRQLLPSDSHAEEGRGLEVRFFCTDRSTTGSTQGDACITMGRMDIQEMISAEARTTGRKNKLTVISCGPAEMADEVRKVTASCVRKGHWIELVEEAFAW
jgi:hypothetical protein